MWKVYKQKLCVKGKGAGLIGVLHFLFSSGFRLLVIRFLSDGSGGLVCVAVSLVDVNAGCPMAT